jgi:DNA-binding transcriptional ArsR family regulator
MMLYNYNMSAYDRYDIIFRALADPKRRQMLDLLKHEPHTTGSLCRHFKSIDRCTVMQHLDVLERAELIIVKRQGRHRWNYINPLPIKKIYDRWINDYATGAVQLLARMKRDMESVKRADLRSA